MALLYTFFLSISLIGVSFKFLGIAFAEQLVATTANPFVGLFIGVLATSMVQSSSTITSMVVGLVAGGALDVQSAIPIVLGSNVGTSVTNTLVSVGHISRPAEFKRAFAAATIHDFFNLITLLILFPIQLATDLLGKSASFLALELKESGGLKLINPIKMIVSPTVKWITELTAESGILILVIAVILLFISLRYMVTTLKAIVIGGVEHFFDSTLFRNAGRALVSGLLFTVLVQSSSITTSLAVPLAGAGLLTLRQIFPFTLGANIGTTITAIMASLVTGNQAAIAVAFAHFFFNIFGIILVWPIRRIPLYLAETLAAASLRSKIIPVAYIVTVFFLIPIILIYTVG